MFYLDLLLNLVALLLAFAWRVVGLDRQTKPPAVSLLSTIKRAETRPARPWSLLATLCLLLVGRSLLYWHLSDSSPWAPSLDLGLASFSFRIDTWPRALLFSCASFFHASAIALLALLPVVLLNRKAAKADPFQLLLNAQWGFLSRWPALVLILLVPIAGASLWVALQQPLVWLGITSTSDTLVPGWQQALAFGLNLLLVWPYVASVTLLVHWAHTYVYIGNFGLWNCLALAGHRLIRWLPLQFSKLDLAPPVGIVLAVALAHFAGRGAAYLFTHPLH
jgi:hypothetical protein